MGQKIPAMFHISKFLSLKSLHFNFALIMSVWEPSPGKESKITEVGVGGGQSRMPSPFADFAKVPLTKLLLTF